MVYNDTPDVSASDPNKDEQDPSQVSPPISSNDNSSPSSTPKGSSSSSSSAPAYSPSGTKSGSFQNVQNYINANQGYNGGNGMGGQVYDTLKDQQQQQENGIGQATSGFNTATSDWQSGGTYDPSKVSSFVQQATTNPVTAANDPTQLGQYQSYLNASYNGPNGLQNAGDLQNNAQQYAQTTQLTSSDPGRMALLNKLYGGANAGSQGYTQGEQSLDNVLMSTPQQLQTVQQAQGLGSQLQTDFNQAQSNAQNQAKQFQNNASTDVNAATTGLTNAAKAINDPLVAKAATDNTTASTAYNSLLGDLQSGKITSADLGQMGLTPAQVADTYGAQNNPNGWASFLSQSPQATASNEAQTGDVNNLQALAKLAGTYVPNVGVMASSYDPTQAGTYTGTAPKFDAASFMNQVTAGKNAENTAYQNLLTPIGLTSNNGDTSQATVSNPGGNWIGGAGSGIQSSGDIKTDIANLNNRLIQLNGAADGQGSSVPVSNALQQLQSIYSKYGTGLNVDQSNSAPVGPVVQSPTKARF